MARSRNIKPGFFKDAKVVRCSFEARLLFQGLWCIADYMGRLKYEPLEIKMEVFPADNVDIDKLMSELTENKLIEAYSDNSGTALVQVTNFTRHQNPHINEKVGKDKKPAPCLPGPHECKPVEPEKTEEKPDKIQQLKDAIGLVSEYYQSDPADSLLLIPDSLKLIPDSGLPRDPLDLDPEEVEELVNPPKKKRRFTPPSLQEVEGYIRERNGDITQASLFTDYYESNGWKVGKNPMKDWKASLRGWLSRSYSSPKTGYQTAHEQRAQRSQEILDGFEKGEW